MHEFFGAHVDAEAASAAVRAKQLLRRLVVWSARPPLARLFRAAYQGVLAIAVRRLRRHDCVLAIYVCRGCAADKITPGISDIDLVVVTRAGSAHELAAVRQTFQRLGSVTQRLVDSYPNLVLTRETLERRWRSAPAWQFRYQEGRTGWRLLFGTDVLAGLPALPARAWRTACVLEMARWWLLFADIVLATSRHRTDRVLWNATCYKAVSECLRVREALATGALRSSREAVLERLHTPLGQRLRALAAARFLSEDPGIADACLSFLVSFFVEVWAGDPPLLPADTAIVQRLDAPQHELCLSLPARAQLRGVARFAKRRWGAPTARMVPSAFWPRDEWLLIVALEPARLPSVAACAELVQLHRSLQVAGSPAVHLFMKLGRVLFPLTPTLPADLHRGLPTPATMPDIFLQLGEEDVSWTDFCAWYLCGWRSNEQWLQASGSQRRQLEAIRLSAAEGSVLYPLTGPALERAWAARSERP